MGIPFIHTVTLELGFLGDLARCAFQRDNTIGNHENLEFTSRTLLAVFRRITLTTVVATHVATTFQLSFEALSSIVSWTPLPLPVLQPTS